MNEEAFAIFSVCLQCISPGNAPPWSPAVARFYLCMLKPIPDEDMDMMTVAIGQTAHEFRPQPAEILETWRKLTNPNAHRNAAEVVAAIYVAIEEPRYVEMLRTESVFVADPGQVEKAKEIVRNFAPRGIEDTSALDREPRPRITGTWVDRQVPVMVRTFGEPPSITNDPILSAVVAAMGGWTAISSGPGEGTPAGVFRGQLRAMAEHVIAGAADVTMRELRLEYQAQARARLEAEQKQIETIEPV